VVFFEFTTLNYNFYKLPVANVINFLKKRISQIAYSILKDGGDAGTKAI